MFVAYILSGKNGIVSFTFKELELLQAYGIQFQLFFTKLHSVNNQPQKDWPSCVFSWSALLAAFFNNFFTIFFQGMVYEAICNGELIYYLTALTFYDKAKHSSFNAVHVQMGDHKLIVGYYLARMLKSARLSTTIHAHELYSILRYDKHTRYVFLLNQCTRIFTISEFNKKILTDELEISPQKIDVMYLYPSFHRTDSIKVPIKILMVGNWERKKGYEDVIEAIKAMNRDDFVIYVVGRNVNPDEDLDLPRIISDNNLQDQIKLLGAVNREFINLLFECCDVFLLPSKTDYHPNGKVKEREGIPVALMEAMMYGMPILSTKHAGIPELVAEYLVPENDPAALASELNNLLNNLPEVKRRAWRNTATVNSRFSVENNKLLANYFKSPSHE